MRWISRSDECVVGNVQPCPEVLKLRRESVAMDLRINSGLRGCLLDFLPMLVQPRQKKHIPATKSPKACKDIGRDRGIGVTDMRDVVDLIKRGGDIERLMIAHPV